MPPIKFLERFFKPKEQLEETRVEETEPSSSQEEKSKSKEEEIALAKFKSFLNQKIQKSRSEFDDKVSRMVRMVGPTTDRFIISPKLLEAQKIAEENPEAIAALMPLIDTEQTFNLYYNDVVTMAKHLPKHAVALKDLFIKNPKRAMLQYSLNVEKFRDIDDQNFKEVVPGTRLSGTMEPEEIESFYQRNIQYHQKLKNNLQKSVKQSFDAKLQDKEPKDKKFSEKFGEDVNVPIINLENKITLSLQAFYSKEHEMSNQFSLEIKKPQNIQSIMYGLEIMANGVINAGNIKNSMEKYSGYMFLPDPHAVGIKELKNQYPNQRIFINEEKLVEILSEENFEEPEIQEKIKEILNPVLEQIS